MLGALLALAAAAMFGLNIAALRRGVLGGSVFQALAVTVWLGVPLFALGCLAFGAIDEIAAMSPWAWGWFTAAGVVHFVIGRYSNYRATRALGAAQSGPIVQVSLLVALALALIFLGESLTPLKVVGIVLIMAGPALILASRARAGGKVVTKSGLTLNYVEGYFFGLVSAGAWGLSPILIRFGLEEAGGIEASLAGGFVSYLAAGAAVCLIALLPRNLADIRKLDRKGIGWFGLTAVLVWASQMFLFMALAVAPVTVVVPVQRTAVIFRVIFTWLLNREHEILSLSILLGIALSTIGVFAVTISVDQLAEWLPLPSALVEAARLRWP